MNSFEKEKGWRFLFVVWSLSVFTEQQPPSLLSPTHLFLKRCRCSWRPT